MDLKLKDVAELLNVSETTVRRWLSDGKIPAYRLNHQYRFSRIEIENWMMECKLQQQTEDKTLFVPREKQIYPSEKKETARSGMNQFSLYRAIHRGGVYSEIEGADKETVIRGTMEVIAPKFQSDADVLSELLLDREKLQPTALNGGIAVPHSRECLQRIPFDLVAVVFPKEPIGYGAMDGNPVHSLFFLFASGDKIHLQLLAKIAHFSSDPEAVEFLSKRPGKTAFLEFVRNWELNLNS
ncbi:MAG: Nitrogen regulatory protein [Chlamydiae bacterium]|nr:Nitrogen regulatory protein [Chlamydiota bacterium]